MPRPVTAGDCDGGIRMAKLITEASFREQVMAVAAFRSALRGFEADTAIVVRRCRLTPQRYLLLLMIKGAVDGSEQATVSAISNRLRIPHNTVSELVTRAVAAGLVQRTPVPGDRRSAALSLTAEGGRRLRCAVERLEDPRSALRRSLQRSGR
jgi:DNA-binding MarR family transcriptional regulator